jgi:hypothetical protein
LAFARLDASTFASAYARLLRPLLVLLAYLMLIASILPMFASILTRFAHCMFGHLAARSDHWTVIRFFEMLAGSFARLHDHARSAIRLDLWSFDGG